jgi:hypothetical protein
MSAHDARQSSNAGPPPSALELNQAMTHPPYVIDTVVLVLGAALAFVVALIGFYLMPEIADLMPPALNGSP